MRQESVEVGGVVARGVLTLERRDLFLAALSRFPDGDVTVTVEARRQKRTSPQNRFFHGPILRAFESLGYHKQEAKDMLCLMFIPQEVRQMDGTVATVPGHTSVLDVQEFNALIDQCIQLAAENDIVIEDADIWRERMTA